MRIVAVLWCALALAGCATVPRQTGGAPSATDIIRSYHAAISRRDLLPLTLYVAPDVEWYSAVDGERILEVSGREALADMLRAYFSRNLSATWSFDAATTHGAFVAVRERSQWRGANENGERITVCVYELQDGRIRRITQFLSGQ